jgi:hypothetical protein
MRKIIIVMMTLCLTGMAFAQKDPISAAFDNYAGKEGFTTVNITGDMLKLLTQMEEERKDTTFVSKLNEVKILAIDKGCGQPSNVNFRTEVYDKLDKSVYKEMMTVEKKDEDVHILVKELHGRIAELLVFVSGKDDNVMIQLKGDIVLKEMADMANTYKMNGFEQLKRLEK